MSSRLQATSYKLHYVFFGTGEIAVGVLDELEKSDLLPSLIVTAPDKPAGRGKILTPPPVKQWEMERGLEILQPDKLDSVFCSKLQATGCELFVVVDYGTFLSKKILDIPSRGVVNMHPSLLPRLRGPSPIRSAILNDEKETGVSIMLVDEKMDHGPLIARRHVPVPDWPPRGSDLDRLLSREGGKLLAEIMPLWKRGDIEAQEQHHDLATYSRLFTKEDGLLDLVNGDPYQNLLKIRAFEGWPGTHAFFERSGRRIRVQIIDAHLDNGKLVIDVVKPEGKSEMPYVEFARRNKDPVS